MALGVMKPPQIAFPPQRDLFSTAAPGCGRGAGGSASPCSTQGWGFPPRGSSRSEDKPPSCGWSLGCERNRAGVGEQQPLKLGFQSCPPHQRVGTGQRQHPTRWGPGGRLLRLLQVSAVTRRRCLTKSIVPVGHGQGLRCPSAPAGCGAGGYPTSPPPNPVSRCG